MGFADEDGLRNREGVVEVGSLVTWGRDGDGDGGVAPGVGEMFSLSLLLLRSLGGGSGWAWVVGNLG